MSISCWDTGACALRLGGLFSAATCWWGEYTVIVCICVQETSSMFTSTPCLRMRRLRLRLLRRLWRREVHQSLIGPHKSWGSATQPCVRMLSWVSQRSSSTELLSTALVVGHLPSGNQLVNKQNKTYSTSFPTWMYLGNRPLMWLVRQQFSIHFATPTLLPMLHSRK